MIILNEKEYAENCLQNGIVDKKPFFTLSILAKYYYYECGYRKKKIMDLLLEYLSKYYPRYELNKFGWQITIEKIANSVASYQFYKINGVKITKSELGIIRNLHNRVLERLAFTMLCLAKLGNERNTNNNGWVNAEPKDIFKYARISCRSEERAIKIGKLWQKGLLEFPKKNGNLNCRVTFIDADGDEELFISDFRELGYEYQRYTGEKFIRCAECGILTKKNPNDTKKYCENCAGYIPQKNKTIVCVDCKKKLEISSSSRRIRCDECDLEHKRMIDREKKRRKRKSCPPSSF